MAETEGKFVRGEEKESCLAKLATQLQEVEDLDKIAVLKSDVNELKASIDERLRTGLKEQREVIQSGLTNLHESESMVWAIREEMKRVDELCRETGDLIREFRSINLVAQVHRNFTLVASMRREMEDLDGKLTKLESMLREDDMNMEEQVNLLAIHLGLSKLRDFRDAVMEQARSSGEGTLELIRELKLASGSTLEEYFTRLDDLVDWFDDHIGQTCMNLIALVRSDRSSLVVRLALIIEEEEKKDMKKRLLAEAQGGFTTNPSISTLSVDTSSEGNGERYRGYKAKFLRSIEMNVERQMKVVDEKFTEDSDKLEKSMRWYFNDLNAVKLGMVRLMPRKWDIFNTYVDIYHGKLHDWLISRINDEELTPRQMLSTTRWEEIYYEKMRKLGVSKSELKVELLDGRGRDLMKQYLGLIVKTVEEWMERIAERDKRDFLRRSEGVLDTQENGLLCSKTGNDTWKMLMEQLNVAESCEREEVYYGVIEATLIALTRRQRMWEGIINQEFENIKNQVDKDPNGNIEGLESLQEYLVAIANDQIACIDDGDEEKGGMSYLSRIGDKAITMLRGGIDNDDLDAMKKKAQEKNKFDQMTSMEMIANIQRGMESLRDGYVDLSTLCLEIFVRLIFVVDFRGLLREIFTPAWIIGGSGLNRLILRAVSTFDDYLSDFLPVLHPSLRDVLVEELASQLLIDYLVCAARNPHSNSSSTILSSMPSGSSSKKDTKFLVVVPSALSGNPSGRKSENISQSGKDDVNSTSGLSSPATAAAAIALPSTSSSSVYSASASQLVSRMREDVIAIFTFFERVSSNVKNPVPSRNNMSRPSSTSRASPSHNLDSDVNNMDDDPETIIDPTTDQESTLLKPKLTSNSIFPLIKEQWRVIESLARLFDAPDLPHLRANITRFCSAYPDTTWPWLRAILSVRLDCRSNRSLLTSLKSLATSACASSSSPDQLPSQSSSSTIMGKVSQRFIAV